MTSLYLSENCLTRKCNAPCVSRRDFASKVWETFVAVASSQNAYSQSQLAAKVGISANSMVRIMDQLVNAGLIQPPVRAERDRRVKRVFLTETGRKYRDETMSEKPPDTGFFHVSHARAVQLG
jgi:DNA-binding MarR family transcriptional regulator